jgi:two-component system sensor histidine kinase/response regulator
MLTPHAPLQQPIAAVQFDRIQQLLQQTVQAVAPAVVLTETELGELADAQRTEPQPDRFTLVASARFSALLTGVRLSDAPDRYKINLTFAPESIAVFVDAIAHALPAASSWQSQLQQARSMLQVNDATLQSELTLRLIAELVSAPEESVATALHQQIEQERLLNQVMTQIRKSLELPVILQTAVEQVRQFLQVDRLVVYQLHVPAPATEVGGLPTGVITYEAKASEAIPAILHLVEDCYLLLTPQANDRYRRGFTLAVADVQAKYAHAPCLVNFLQNARVRAKLVAPIVVQEQLWGLLIAHQCDQPRQWQQSEEQLLLKVAEHLAIAIGLAQLYTQVQRQNQTLEQRVQERIQDLRDALLAVQTANQAKSEFLAAMSHELRTPLTAVIGMSATLLRWSFGELNQRQRHYLQTIHASGERLMQLVNDILDLSQLEAGKAVLNVSEFSLSHLVRLSLRTVQEKAALSGVALELDLRVDATQDSFRADSRRVQQILLNLLSNAIKFTPRGGKVTLRALVDCNGAVLQVKDTGIGISDQQRSLLFQKFQQLDTSYHRQYEGAGVGLALTKQLVELHGGSIAVDSTVGIGSVFTVRLPQQHPPTQAMSAVAPAMRFDQQPGRMMLIENHDENATVICDLLTAAGYQVIWLLDSSAALEQIEVLQPIAVIVALHSPQIDGTSLIRKLRQNPLTKATRVIALTRTATVEDQTHGLAIGADECLPLPIQPDYLLHRLVALTTAQQTAGLSREG